MLGFIVGLTILPAVPEDTYPLERQGTNDHLVSLSFLPLGLVKGPRPEGKAHRLVDPQVWVTSPISKLATSGGIWQPLWTNTAARF